MRDSRSAASGNSRPNRWSRIAERGSLLGMRITVACYRTLGRRVCGVLIDAIVAYFFLTDSAGRRASIRYLRRVHATRAGRRALGRSAGTWASFLRYRAFGRAMLDRLAIWAGKAQDFEYRVQGNEYCDRLAEAGRGGIVVGAHLGNFDALRLLAERQQRIVHALMFTAHAERINRILDELSPDVELRMIESDPNSLKAVFEIRERVQRGELVSILADRAQPGEVGRTTETVFLGTPVEIPQSPFLLAGLLGCPVLLMLAFQTGPGRYDVFTEQLTEGVQFPREEREKGVSELSTAFAARLEHYCERYPYQWFNFYDYWGDDKSS